MPTQVQFRRGTTAQNDVFIGAEGELSVDTDKDTLRVHDGSTAGGFEVLTVDATQTITNKTPNQDWVPAADSAYDLGSPTYKWKDLHLSGNTIYLGDALIHSTGGAVRLPAGSVLGASGTAILDSALARQAFSATDAGGDGSMSYDAGTGVFIYTGPSASETRAHFSGGTGITYNSGTGEFTTTDGDIVHDNLSGFVSDEHIAHSSVSITAGNGLTGGGTIATSRTLNIGEGTGINVSADAIATNDAEIVHDNLSGFVADEHIAHSGVTITAGSGLTGGGNITASRTLNIGEGTGITVSADAIATNDAEIVHDNLSGFVSDEHIAHSGVTLTAGNGLTGGGTIAASRTFTVGAGTGVTVNADNVAIGQDVATTADVTFNSVTTTNGLIVSGDLQVTGTTTTVNSASLEVTDNMIYMNAGESDGSPVQSIDVGWAANVNDGGSYTHVGMFRDATDDRFKVFGAYTPEPDAGLEINTGHASFTLADFQAATFYGALSGNATTATTAAALTTARTIGGVSFDGSANINLPGVNTTGNQNTTGSAATLTTARTIGGVSFNGSANINLPGVNTTGNQNTTGSAATLTTSRTLEISGDATGSTTFNGSSNANISVSLAANSVTSSELSSATSLVIYNSAGTALKTLYGAGS